MLSAAAAQRLYDKGGSMDIRRALLRRPDLPVVVLGQAASGRIDLQFAVATNPALSQMQMERLVSSRNEFVAGAVLANPSLPADVIEALPLTRPAWHLRVAAAHPACSPDKRDALLTWITLGGAPGDPTFDPWSCTGNPGSPDVAAYTEYDRLARLPGADLSPLWRVRIRQVGLGSQASHSQLLDLASWPYSEARGTVARFSPLSAEALDCLGCAPEQWIRDFVARTTPARSRYDKLPPIGQPPNLMVAVALAISLVALLGLFGHMLGDSQTPNFEPSPALSELPRDRVSLLAPPTLADQSAAPDPAAPLPLPIPTAISLPGSDGTDRSRSPGSPGFLRWQGVDRQYWNESVQPIDLPIRYDRICLSEPVMARAALGVTASSSPSLQVRFDFAVEGPEVKSFSVGGVESGKQPMMERGFVVRMNAAELDGLREGANTINVLTEVRSADQIIECSFDVDLSSLITDED
jgi:hypothetical protein